MDERWKIERALFNLGSDGPEWKEAYDILYTDGRKALEKHLRGKAVPRDDSDDIIETIFQSILENRRRLKFVSVFPWYKYLYTAARNARRDHPPHVPGEISVEVPDQSPTAESIILRAFEHDLLHSLADSTWLGQAPSDAPTKLLAAQMLYIDGHPPEKVFAFVCSSTAKVKPQGPSQVASWVGDLWVMRKMAFQALYWSNDRLTNLLLGLPDASAEDLDALGAEAVSNPSSECAVSGWTWKEVSLIINRFRFGMPLRQALGKIPAEGLDEPRALKVCARCESLFPFVNSMTVLWQQLEGHPLRERTLKKNPLWKRLVFHYYAVHELPQEDVIDRVSPPAAVTGYQLNNINTWIASRLVKELKKHFRDGASDA